jgi:hypothetical protein
MSSLKTFIVFYDTNGKITDPEEIVGNISSRRKEWKDEGVIAYYTYKATSLKSKMHYDKSPVKFLLGEVVEFRTLTDKLAPEDLERLQQFAHKNNAYKTVIAKGKVFQVSHQAIILVGENLEEPKSLVQLTSPQDEKEPDDEEKPKKSKTKGKNQKGEMIDEEE